MNLVQDFNLLWSAYVVCMLVYFGIAYSMKTSATSMVVLFAAACYFCPPPLHETVHHRNNIIKTKEIRHELSKFGVSTTATAFYLPFLTLAFLFSPRWTISEFVPVFMRHTFMRSVPKNAVVEQAQNFSYCNKIVLVEHRDDRRDISANFFATCGSDYFIVVGEHVNVKFIYNNHVIPSRGSREKFNYKMYNRWFDRLQRSSGNMVVYPAGNSPRFHGRFSPTVFAMAFALGVPITMQRYNDTENRLKTTKIIPNYGNSKQCSIWPTPITTQETFDNYRQRNHMPAIAVANSCAEVFYSM